jgi:hypothetical protein
MTVRQKEIERGNDQLLKKLMDIQASNGASSFRATSKQSTLIKSHSTAGLETQRTYPKSLQQTYRRMEHERICKENELFVKKMISL